ncbi:PIN domain-containing protein, partial [Stenotrophomonas sp.]|uniref:PIN domain-containing protein n=1 Tax=Stenotrophomonas sp. TaxID=69392 RepID=UPI0028A232A5
MAVANARRLFVDANIWITWGQGFAKAEATTLTELINHGLVKLVSTDLTMMEIAKRFRNNDVAALEPLLKADLKHAAHQYLRLEVPGFDRDKLRASIFDHHLKNVKSAMFSRFQAEMQSIDNVRPSYILEQYTQGAGLFGPSGKKEQFPDAFIFAAVS